MKRNQVPLSSHHILIHLSAKSSFNVIPRQKGDRNEREHEGTKDKGYRLSWVLTPKFTIQFAIEASTKTTKQLHYDINQQKEADQLRSKSGNETYRQR